MRNRIVVWGRNAQEERVLIGIELLAEQNIVKLQTWQEKVVSDEVYKAFMDHWRKGEDVEIPEPHKAYARELSVSEGLLPDELKAEQTDMINRAQTEWHYAVLSEKLKTAYDAELAEINDRIERTDKYDSNLWGQLKTFWEKVQGQLRDKTLLREHGNKLRKDVDKLFDQMKALREKANEEVKEKSAAAVSEFAGLLEDAEKRIEEGTHLRKVFDDLRKIQSKFHNTTFSRDDRKLIYDRIDAAFKSVKAKRNGGEAGSQRAAGNLGRTQARYEGLLKAMEKMERSIGRDKKDLEFEHRRIARTDGQLEAQIRQAKIKMIEARIDSKGEKLEDMNKTKDMLEKRMAKEKKKLEKDEKRRAEQAAAEEVKAKIAQETAAAKAISPEEKAKLEAAAKAIQEGKQSRGKSADASTENKVIANAVAVSEIVSSEEAAPEEAAAAADSKESSLFAKAASFLGSASEKLEDAFEDAVDTAKAVASVASEKIADAVEDAKENLQEAREDLSEELADAKENFQTVKDKASEKLADVVEDAKEGLQEAREDLSEELADAKENFQTVKEKASEKLADAKENLQAAKDKASEKIQAVKEDIQEEIQDLTSEEE